MKLRPCSAVVEVADPSILKILLSDRELGARIRPLTDRLALAIADPERVRARMERLGYLIQTPDGSGLAAENPESIRALARQAASRGDEVEATLDSGRLLSGFVLGADRYGLRLETEEGERYLDFRGIRALQVMAQEDPLRR